MASPMVRGGFSDLMDARFKQIFGDKFKEYPTVYDSIFQPKMSDRYYEKYSSVSGHDIFEETAEGGTPAEDSRIQGYDLQLTNRKFTKKARLSWEALKDDQFNELDKEAAILGRAAKRTPDVHAADGLKRGFSTTDSFGNSMLAADGLRFYSTLHKLNSEDATTQSNASATGITLSDDNLETGMVAMNQQLNPKGIFAGVQANMLVVPPALRKAALIITGSDKRSDTADNDMNVYKGGKLDVKVWTEIGSVAGNGSNTAWFLFDKAVHELIFQWREKPVLHEVVFNQDNMMYEYLMHMRYEFGMVDYRGTWASKGDSAAYSS